MWEKGAGLGSENACWSERKVACWRKGEGQVCGDGYSLKYGQRGGRNGK